MVILIGGLLRVFLAEESKVGLDAVEQFGDDGADAAEEARAGRAFEDVGEGKFVDVGGEGFHRRDAYATLFRKRLTVRI